MRRFIFISEIFHSFQGEGALIGKPTVFVRTGGCDSRCSWCDTFYAVLPENRPSWLKLEPEDIFAKIVDLSPKPILITLSGGNPAIEPLEPLIDMGLFEGYRFSLETQGTIKQPWFTKLDYLTLSPKPPSSGMLFKERKLQGCIDIALTSSRCHPFFKIVIFDEEDYLFAKKVTEKYFYIPVYLQTGNAHVGEDFSLEDVLERTRWLMERVAQDQWNNATVLPQLHTLLFGSKRGV